MTADDSSIGDRLMPGWLTGDSGGESSGGGQPYRRPMERIVQLRDGMRAAVPALPDSRADVGLRAREVAESAASRARAVVSALEEAAGGEGPARAGGAADAGTREVGELLDRVRRALQELHYHVVRAKVVHDHPGSGTGDEGGGELRRALERAAAAADELETLARGATAGDGGS